MYSQQKYMTWFFLKIFIYFFLEGAREVEREGKKH